MAFILEVVVPLVCLVPGVVVGEEIFLFDGFDVDSEKQEEHGCCHAGSVFPVCAVEQDAAFFVLDEKPEEFAVISFSAFSGDEGNIAVFHGFGDVSVAGKGVDEVDEAVQVMAFGDKFFVRMFDSLGIELFVYRKVIEFASRNRFVFFSAAFIGASQIDVDVRMVGVHKKIDVLLGDSGKVVGADDSAEFDFSSVFG